MDDWTLETRTRHVEDCLSVMAIKEETLERTSSVISVKEVRIKEETGAKYEPRDKKRKRKELPDVQKNVVKYINSQKKAKTQTRNTAAQEAPTELLPSSRKTPIPPLKIVSFNTGATNGDDPLYQVSVDAFCYKPHETISQYFLSHFHSDHYGGITKRWCSERTLDSKIIFCLPITSRLLTLRFGVDPQFIRELEQNSRQLVCSYSEEHEGPGLYVTPIDANHCPGAVIFLFESISITGEVSYILHCGDFRINKSMVNHPALRPFQLGRAKTLDKVYLDTTYMSPKYNFPKQELVCDAVADMFEKLLADDKLMSTWLGSSRQSRITDFLTPGAKKKKKFLILVGTYLIGKERLAISILKRLRCPIYISNINSRGDKGDIIKAFDDLYLNHVITDDDLGGLDAEVVVHLVPMKIVGTPGELANYFNHNQYFRHFERCVGLRPTGWTFDFTESADTEDDIPVVDDVSLLSTLTVLRSQPEYSYLDILKKGKPKSHRNMDKALSLYLLPYSEHLSFRELSFFVVFLNITQVIPTVNTELAHSVKLMLDIIEKWELVRKTKIAGNSSLPEGINAMISDLSLEDL